jgi:glyoxylase-like metal-dependent hydrolase (beta-lactamase superfamily II)
MTLEDHVGDVIRKARQAAHIRAEIAAQAAGIKLENLEELELTGRVPGPVHWKRLADAIGLNGAKLEGLAAGWIPNPPDLTQWREVRQIATTQEGNTVNCYLVWDEITRETALFDTGWEDDPILAMIQDQALNLTHVFITHHHEDHIAALPDLRRRFPRLKVHSGDKTQPPQERNRLGDFIHLGNLRITHRDTPGHSEDGTTYIVGHFPEDAPHIAVVGDVLFAGSMGRGFQSTELLKRSIREQILTLPSATLICAGHGPLTTLEQEKDHNPFL